MTTRYKKSFYKDYQKLRKHQRQAWELVIGIFLTNPFKRELHRHKLRGKYNDFESINITPDLRALFKQEDHLVIFYYIRNHNQLYS